jgi:hypothetical protein
LTICHFLLAQYYWDQLTEGSASFMAEMRCLVEVVWGELISGMWALAANFIPSHTQVHLSLSSFLSLIYGVAAGELISAIAVTYSPCPSSLAYFLTVPGTP